MQPIKSNLLELSKVETTAKHHLLWLEEIFVWLNLQASELIIDQLVGFRVVELAHLGSSHRLGTGIRIFLDLF